LGDTFFFRGSNCKLINSTPRIALLRKPLLSASITVKIRFSIADISLTKHDLGLKPGAIVFYDLVLGYNSLFSNFLGASKTSKSGQIWPYHSKGKFTDFKKWPFSPQN